MAYEVRVLETDRIVELIFIGACDRKEHESSRDEAFEICKDLNFSSMLVDLRRGSMEMTSQELFIFGKSLEAAITSGNIRIAVMIREEDGATNLTVAVAQTREVQIRAFLTEEEAKSWLME